jgi:hypothetical protein
MQQLTVPRSRWSPKGQWVQLGVFSASVLTPLLSRWNELRAAERARALREQAEERLKGARGLLPWSRHEAQQQIEEIVRRVTAQVSGRQRSRRVSTLWLVGAGVGLVAAGVTTYVVVRRQLDWGADGQLVVLPAPSSNGHGKAPLADIMERMRRPRGTQPATAAPAADTAVAALAAAAQADAAPMDVAPMEMEDATEAKFIGNIRTMIFHEANADNLPAEENRVYFASEEEARIAGYRRDRDEVPGEPGAQAQANE